MWNIPSVVSVLCLLHHACSQNPDFFQNLDCVTHDLENLSCRWDTPYPAEQKIQYKVCSKSQMSESCFETTGNELVVEFQVFSTSDISIEAKDVPGNPSTRFQKSYLNITYVPYPPEIHSLVPNYQTDVLSVEWTVNSTSFISEVKLSCEMNVLRGENLLLVKNETVEETWSSDSGLFHWNWTSDFPLNCVSHSVRVRCFVHEEYYAGEKRMSDWSAIKTVSDSSSEEDEFFPNDIAVPVGSNANFCCKINSGHQIESITFKSNSCSLVDLGSNSSSGIRLTNLEKSGSSGDNIICYTHGMEYATGTVVFVGYPPEEPQDFSCEARHLKVINCTWKAGRDTGLYGPKRGTKYTLYERFSRMNTSCSVPFQEPEELNCSFGIQKEQDLHEFWLLARNPLGSSNTSLVINITERIHPLPIDGFIMRDTRPTVVYLSWSLRGKYKSINLLCEIEIKLPHGETETRNVTFEGLNDSRYDCEVGNLHPYHIYEFRVRCASRDHFWKWSDWSNSIRHTTQTAAPSKKLDIWREIHWRPEGREIKVYWKHLTPKEANGVVTSYKVMWTPLYSDGMPEIMQMTADLNRSTIILSSSDEQDYEINVTAVNSAGSSLPSRITTAVLPNDVKLEKIEGEGNGFNITWRQEPGASCGYLVKWIPSSHPPDSALMWRRFSSNAAGGFISSKHFQAGLRYNITLYVCNNDTYKVLREMIVYGEELAPLMAPNFTVSETTSRSLKLKWEPMSEEYVRGFLQGYLAYVMMQQNDSSETRFQDLDHRTETKVLNITNPAERQLSITGLRSSTSYTLGLQAYTKGGMGPIKSFSVLTNDHAVSLILAILIPILVAIVLGVVSTAICYRKREWIKETFYPDIPNPENSKALQFPKNTAEGTKPIKTLEMNRCTPSSVEVVEPFPKILDTELNSPMSDNGKILEDGSESLDDNHTGVIYTQPATHEDTSNSGLDGSASPSVVYIDVQSMYQPQANSEDEPDIDFVDGAGYKPQMQLPITSTVNMDNGQASTEDDVATSSGYRPQGLPNAWATDSPGSPTSIGSENASFGSPCSVNSRNFLIPPVDTKDSHKPTHIGWSISSLFQSKQDE